MFFIICIILIFPFVFYYGCGIIFAALRCIGLDSNDEYEPKPDECESEDEYAEAIKRRKRKWWRFIILFALFCVGISFLYFYYKGSAG